jgi:hypothetical protein
VPHGVEVDPERVAVGLAGLDLVAAGAEGQHRRLRDVDVVHREVEVELLRPLRVGPGGRDVVVRLLEGEARAGPELEHDPVRGLGVVVELAADQGSVELGQGERVRAVEDDGPQASRGCHGASKGRGGSDDLGVPKGGAPRPD